MSVCIYWHAFVVVSKEALKIITVLIELRIKFSVLYPMEMLRQNFISTDLFHSIIFQLVTFHYLMKY